MVQIKKGQKFRIQQQKAKRTRYVHVEMKWKYFKNDRELAILIHISYLYNALRQLINGPYISNNDYKLTTYTQYIPVTSYTDLLVKQSSTYNTV